MGVAILMGLYNVVKLSDPENVPLDAAGSAEREETVRLNVPHATTCVAVPCDWFAAWVIIQPALLTGTDVDANEGTAMVSTNTMPTSAPRP